VKTGGLGSTESTRFGRKIGAPPQEARGRVRSSNSMKVATSALEKKKKPGGCENAPDEEEKGSKVIRGQEKMK